MGGLVDFEQRFEAAVEDARAKLGSSFTLTADRAGAYLEIAKVLSDQGKAVASSDVEQSNRYIQAARMLQEQAEITTYSGESGRAAIAGNLNAKIANGALYGIKLDKFSYNIDDAVVSFMEDIVLRKAYDQISRNNILSVDGLVWDSYGLIDYFPGKNVGYTFDASLDSSVWQRATDEQKSRLFGSQQTISLTNETDILNALLIGTAVGSPQVVNLDKTPASFGFSASAIADVPLGGSLDGEDSNGNHWRLLRSEDDIITIINNNVGSDVFGHTAFVDNKYNLAAQWQGIGATLAGTLFPASLYASFAEEYIDPENHQVSYILTNESVDNIKNFMGADYGELGTRWSYLNGGTVLTFDDFIVSGPGAAGKGSISAVSVLDDPNNADGKVIVVRAPTADGSTKITTVQVGNASSQPSVEGRITITLAADGTIVAADVTDEEATRVLNLAEAARIKAQLDSYARAMAGVEQPKLTYDDLGNLIGLDDGLTGGGATSEIARAFLSARVASDGTLILAGHTTKLVAFDPRTKIGRYQISSGTDAYGRSTVQEWDFNLQSQDATYSGIMRTTDGDVTITHDDGGPTTIRLTDSPINIDFVNAAEVIANTFGRYIAGDDVITQTVTSAALKTIADNFGDVLNTLAFDGGTATSDNLSHAFDGLDQEFLDNLKSAGVGAVSSYLTAQLVDAIGVGGLPGELLTTEAGQVINTILSNAAGGKDVFDGLSTTSLASAAGSFAGNKLAEEIAGWDEVGEQIGAQIGSAIGATIGSSLPVIGTAIGAFVGDLVGGLVGGLFTGKPESGAILGYDADSGHFAVDSVWKKDGGKKQVARQLGNTAAITLNGIIDEVGGELLNGSEIEGGSYGMRSKAYVYWDDGTSSDNREKFEGPQDLLSYGVMRAAEDFQIIGGDVVTKRAFYNTIALGVVTSSTPDTGNPLIDGVLQDMGDFTHVDYGLDMLLGNLSLADRLNTYLHNSASINALIAAEPDSVFSAEWLLTLSQASDLGLLKRNTHDWDGGFSYLLNQGGIDARDVGFQFEALSREGNGERYMTLDGAVLEDTVDSGSKTVIQGSASDEMITATSGGTRDGISKDSSYHVSNVFHGGAGDDFIRAGDSGDDLFGDAGNDILVGGSLDDWLFGGDGDDVLDANGGSGNVLFGGAGNDRILGADGDSTDPMNSGSDWLEGASGDDILSGRGGDDYFEGGQGDDKIDGGEGNDTIIFRKGDGRDSLSDSGTSTTQRDILEFGHNVSSNDITVVAHSAGVDLSLLVGDASTGDRIDLRGAVTNGAEGIEEFNFTDADWSKTDLASRAVYSKTAGRSLTGTAGDDTLTGTIYDDTLNGGGGQDSLSGGDGSDTYLFNLGDGDVTIEEIGAAADVDALVFGAGIALSNVFVSADPDNPTDVILTIGDAGDKITLKHQDAEDGSQSIEELRFADGTSLTLPDLFRMGTGAAFAGATDDVPPSSWDQDLNGGNGVASFTYNIGDGAIRLSGYDSNNDILIFGAGISLYDLVLTRNPADTRDVMVRFASAPGVLLLNDQDAGNSTGFEQIQFADGTIWDRETLCQKLAGRASSAGADTITDGYSSTVIEGGAGDDVIYGGRGADTIIGGLGDDNMYGGDGGNTFVYNLGDGNDRIDQGDHGDTDILQLGAGIAPSDVIVTHQATDSRNVLIRFVGNDGSILLEDQSGGSIYDASGIEEVHFADGTIWDRVALDAQIVLQAQSDQNDIIRGGRSEETIEGGAGDDVIYGSTGADTIIGGLGDDNMYGGDGGNTFVYNLGDG
ncbi:calcium-binding protein, partial [Altericroceibacterium endophyticum]